MKCKLLAAVAAALALGSASAFAGTASIQLTGMTVETFDLNGSPAAPAVFSGSVTADSDVLAWPPINPYGGPPGWTGYSGGEITRDGAFTWNSSSSEVDNYFGSTGFASGWAGFGTIQSTDEIQGYVAASGGSPVVIASRIRAGGTFELAGDSELVVKGILHGGESNGYAFAKFTFTGADPSSWSFEPVAGNTNGSFELVFRNSSADMVTGVLSADLFATSVPEPTSAFMIGAATLLGLLWRRSPRGHAKSTSCGNTFA